MGCGQSHIPVIYPRKSKAKGSPPSGKKDYLSPLLCLKTTQGGGSDDSDEEAAPPAETALVEELPPAAEDEEAAARMRQMVQLSSSPLLAQTELSTSQSDFFKMLDEKINNGPDYDPNGEYEFAMDHSQLCRLLQEWQAAKQRSMYGMHKKPMQRYHSLQSNGELGAARHKLQHQMTYATAAPPPQQFVYASQYDQYPVPQMRHYQPPPPPQYHPQYHHVANSVVMYDKNRGGYYTELA
ncbi:uncharacterized protein LOC106667827 isoform X2 [Cimex lectularius]|uniref:Uncharacterized protein n=1 Tax=Cimex lectularius TaxID=79782 RepID=A0A8I6SHP5_CIMLE|nr:uncharacterized protein LOC106667827 isoform X2 [Cimex lectularius]